LDVSPGSDGVDGAGTLDLSALRSRSAEDPGPAGPAPGAEAPRPDAPDWAAERFGFSGGDRLAVLTHAPGHILSAVASAFSAGAALVIPDPAVSADIGALSDWLRVSGVTVAYLSPPLLRALAGHGARLPVLRYAFITNAGDLLGQDIAALAQVSPQCRGVGVYRIGRDGYPLALYPVPDGWQPQTAPLRIPLGTELPGAPAQLRHPSGQAAAIGEIAELWFGEYRTGDLARRWPDGTLDYAGADGTNLAADAAETVAALRDLPGVWDAVVTEHVTVDGTTTRTGYVAGPDPEPDAAAKASELRQRLARLLPDYLIPGQLLVVSELPLTGSGDYDLSALPEPLTEGGPADSYAAPRTPMEGELAGILEELLAVDQVGIHDSFFELGGFSLLATRLTSRIRETFDVDLPLRAVFESPTVEQLAQLIVRTQGEMSGTEDLAALLDEIGS
jgi:acyl carrier protein